jgi:MinD-like ATPase involved in chromosome partitioning or flagellar assembly
LPGLRIVPSGEAGAASTAGWRSLLAEARADADIVLVDVGAGMHGEAGQVCAACTHALVVLSAEPASLRALPDHLRRIVALGTPGPKLAGIVLNMLDYRAKASLEVLKQLCSGPSARLTFDVPIGRSPAFLEAVARGLPLSRSESGDAPTVGWVFEMLASNVLERLGIGTPTFDDAPLL